MGLVAYVVLAGADFGGGFWEIVSRQPHVAERRNAITLALGPVWEVNHVWLIAVIVFLFTAFPLAFATISTALFLPMTLAGVGIVLRGVAFTFRAHAAPLTGTIRWLGTLFGAASIITPFLFGICVGTLGSGKIYVLAGQVKTNNVLVWLAPFPLLIGFLAVALCAFLAAVYLTLETQGAVREDFRRRALGSGVAVAIIATIALPVAVNEAPLLWQQLIWGRATPLVIATIRLSLVAMVGMWQRHYKLARLATIAEVACIVWGWALAQAPYIVVPSISVTADAAPPATLKVMLIVWAIGSLVLLPSLALLLKVFKGHNPALEEPDFSS
jgi:cytochrome d ubiquinol oxidase subunit II